MITNIDGECFGVKEFFCGLPYEFTAQSKGLTTVMKIQRSHILDVLKRFPKDYETFQMIRDELTFIEPDKNLKCQPCQRYDHTLYQCPQMHFLRRKQNTIFKYVYSQSQERNQVHNKSRRKQKQNALGNKITSVKQDLKLLRVNLIIEMKKKTLLEERQKQSFVQNIKSQDSVNMANKNLFQESSKQYFESSSDSDSNSSISISDSQYNNKQKQSKQQNTKILTHEEKELIENTNEGQDELFYFKCPLLTWDEEKKRYILSNDQDDSEGNLAIMAYIEQNFSIGNGDFQSIDQNLFANNPNFRQTVVQRDTNDQRMTNFQLSPTQINQNKSLQPNKTSNKSFGVLPNIVEEDNLIQISQNSLDDFAFSLQRDKKQQGQQLDQIQNIIKFKNNEANIIQSNKQYNNSIFSSNDDQLIKPTQIHANIEENIDNNMINQAQVTSQFQTERQIQSNNRLNSQQKIDAIQQANVNQNSNPFEKENRSNRTSKHYKTFKQLKTILSLSLEQSNKQKEQKIKQIEGDQVDEEPTSNRHIISMPQYQQDGRQVLNQFLNENLSMNNKQEESKQLYTPSQLLSRQAIQKSQPLARQDENSQIIKQQNNVLPNNIIKSDSIQNNFIFNHQANDIGEFLSFMFSFEKCHNYSKYYPKGNMKNVLNRYIKYQDKFSLPLNKQIIQQRTGKVTPRTPQYKKEQNQRKASSKFSKMQ